MDQINEIPELGSQAFWSLYDAFCEPEHLKSLITTGKACHLSEMQSLMEAAQRSGTIYGLSRPERGWKKHQAWLVINQREVLSWDGNPWIFLQPGDVIAIEWQWNRDIILTHSPIRGNLLHGCLERTKWNNTIGCFAPLFDRLNIMECVKLRVAENVRQSIAQTESEAIEWQWP